MYIQKCYYKIVFNTFCLIKVRKQRLDCRSLAQKYLCKCLLCELEVNKISYNISNFWNISILLLLQRSSLETFWKNLINRKKSWLKKII